MARSESPGSPGAAYRGWEIQPAVDWVDNAFGELERGRRGRRLARAAARAVARMRRRRRRISPP